MEELSSWRFFSGSDCQEKKTTPTLGRVEANKPSIMSNTKSKPSKVFFTMMDDVDDGKKMAFGKEKRRCESPSFSIFILCP